MTTASDYRPVAQSAPATSTAQLLKVLTPEIARALPKGMDADRIARLVTTAIRKSRNAKAAGTAKHSLDECTQESFAGSLLTASALGLEPDVNGECYLIPYRDNRRRVVECQLQIGYQGIVKLFWNHPRAQGVKCEAVYSNDTIIEFTKGTGGKFTYRPTFGDRGEVVCYYAEVTIAGVSEPLWDVFTPDQIKNLRRGKVGPSGDIKDPERWMERKTALKQVLKLAPKTPRLDAAIRADERTGTELSRSQAIELPSAVEQTPDYIEGEFDDEAQYAVEPTPDSPEVEMATTPQTTKLAIIREERYAKTPKGRADWFAFVAMTVGREVDSNTQLTKAEASVLIDVLEPTQPEGN